MSGARKKQPLGSRKSVKELQDLQLVRDLRRTFSAGASQTHEQVRPAKDLTSTKKGDHLSTAINRRASYDHGAESQFSSAREDVLKELAKHKPLSASDSQIEVDASREESSGKASKGKRLRSTYKKLKEEVFTPVMERARRVSRTISRPFAEDWSSDEDEEEEETDPLSLFASQRAKKLSAYSTDSEDTEALKRNLSEEQKEQGRGRRKSAAGFLVSYASQKLHQITHSGSTESLVGDWVYAEDIEQYENTRTGELYSPETTVLSELHPKELDFLRTLSRDRYNERNTGVTVSIPKDPGRKLKRSSSYRGKKSLEKENHKLLAGGIFEMPLHVVLQIDAINKREESTLGGTCIRDVKRKHKEEGIVRSLTPKLGRRFGSLKARSISPINLATRFQNGAVDDNDCLKVPNSSVCRSFSTPSTPLDSRKLRAGGSASSLYNKNCFNTPPTLNDVISKLSNLPSKNGSQSHLLEGEWLSNQEVPAIIQHCCYYIIQNGLDQQGIFRVCGAKKQVRTLRAEFNTTSNMHVQPDTSVHVVAGLIKEFLKELPEALLTKSLYQPFLHCRQLLTLEERLEAYKELIRLLPGPNRDTLQYLLRFFNVVAENCEDRFDNDGLPIEGNKMDISNLAVVIGPNILHRRKRGGSDSKSQLANEAWEAPIVIEVVKELIQQHRLFFTVDGYIRKEVLKMMHETKLSHFNDVMSEYTDGECGGRLTPDISLESKGRSTTESENRRSRLMNGSSGFVSGGCSLHSSMESLHSRPCSDSREECRLGYCDRQHSSPELSQSDIKTQKRLSKSVDQKEELCDNSSLQFQLEDATSSSEGLYGKDAGYDLTPPSSPLFERNSSKSAFCTGRLGKSSSVSGYGALSPNQTFTQFRLDRMTVGGAPTSSPRLAKSRKAAMKKGNPRNFVPPRKFMAENQRQSQV